MTVPIVWDKFARVRVPGTPVDETASYMTFVIIGKFDPCR
jgi:hypothetical protein